MADIVNLRRARKAKARAEKDKEAESSRALHGTPKHLREITKLRSEKAARDLDAGRLERGENEGD